MVRKGFDCYSKAIFRDVHLTLNECLLVGMVMVWIGFFFTSLAFIFTCAFRSGVNRLLTVTYVVFCACIFTSVYVNGIDWVNYYYVFAGFKTEFSIQYDLLFNMYLYAVANLSGSFPLAVFIFYLASLYIAFRALKNSSLTVNIPAALFAITLLGGMSLVLDQIRQFAAVVICFYSLNYVIDKRFKPFIASVLIASLFHYSAVVALVFWYAYNSSRKPLIIKGASLTACMVFLGGIVLANTALLYTIPLVGAELARKASLYSESISGVGFGVGVVADLILITYYCIRRNDDAYAGIWKVLFIFACMHIGIYFIPAFSRFYYYMFVPLSFLFGHALSTCRKPISAYDSISIVSVVIFISLIVTIKSFDDEKRPGLMEYKTDWVFGDERYIDMIRYERCGELNSILDYFCTR